MLTTSNGLKKPESTDNADLTVFVGDNMDTLDTHITDYNSFKTQVLSGETNVNQVSKVGVTASSENPYIIDILKNTTDFKSKPIEVLKFTPEVDNQIVTEFTFDNADQTSFVNDDYIVFDGKMHLKTSYQDNMMDTGLLDGMQTYETTLDLTVFQSIESIEVI